MGEEIVNRVANSALQTIDLEAFSPNGKRVQLDIKDWLFQGMVLRESEFRSFLKEHDWSAYDSQFVALHCTSDAIIPSWAYMLITTYLSPYADKIVVGDLKDLEAAIFHDVITDFPLEDYRDKPVIIKGCSDKNIPETAYTSLVKKLMPVARSVMFGEGCSSVPLYKKKRV
jgi:hypothetical protein